MVVVGKFWRGEKLIIKLLVLEYDRIILACAIDLRTNV